MNWVLNKTYWACVRPELTQWGPGFDIEDLDSAREVRGGDQETVASERGAGNDVGEGGDGGGRREGLGVVEGERGRVGCGEGVWWCGREGEGGDGGDEV